MNKLVFVMLLLVYSAAPAHAFTGETGMTQELEFVAETQIPGANQKNLTLCYATRSFRVLGFALTSDIQRYALSDDNCETEYRALSVDQMMTAQSLDLIAANIPTIARNSPDRNLRTYGLLTAIGLALFAVVWRRVKSLLGYDPDGPMRKKAAMRILSVMCYAAKCDGLVDSKDLTRIRQTAKRLTRRDCSTADIIHIADHVDLDLDANAFIAFGKGLRDREKDLMMQAALLITMADGRMLPPEYEFVTELAHGLGMPGDDFRRVMQSALGDLDTANP